MSSIRSEQDHVLVLCTYPDQETARPIAAELVKSRLAACVNMSTPFRSIYEWKDEIREDDEVQLTIKTRRDRLPDLAARLRADHPYELPEILAVPVGGDADFMNWIDQCTRVE
ncbi:MAG: divalent-cation tolerance protein CutA [Halothiobacillaceae bacterium]